MSIYRIEVSVEAANPRDALEKANPQGCSGGAVITDALSGETVYMSVRCESDQQTNKGIKMEKAAVKLEPVMVTTSHRGVFFGYADPLQTTEKVVRLERAQMCVSWSAAMKGVMGLAVIGPDTNCRVGPPVAALTLQDVTAVCEMTQAAAAKWEAAPWA